jgi:next-to-BRCA1 protein 1
MKRLLEARARAYIASKKMLQKEPVDSLAGRNRVDADRAKILQARRKAVERIFETQGSSFPQVDENTRERLDAVTHSRPDFPYNALSRLATALNSEPSEETSAPDVVKEETVKEETIKEETAEEKATEVEAAKIQNAAEPQPEASVMIFPQLEKESPASSMHEVSVTTAPEVSTAESAPVEDPEDDEGDLFEDAESVEFLNESSDDEGSFLTDEEYDILDASDEEMP